MIENLAGATALVFGVQLPLVIGITAWLAKREGIKISWLRIALITMATCSVVTGALFLVASSRFGNRDTIMLTLFGTVTACLAIVWGLTRRRRHKGSNRQIQPVAGKPGSG